MLPPYPDDDDDVLLNTIVETLRRRPLEPQESVDDLLARLNQAFDEARFEALGEQDYPVAVHLRPGARGARVLNRLRSALAESSPAPGDQLGEFIQRLRDSISTDSESSSEQSEDRPREVGSTLHIQRLGDEVNTEPEDSGEDSGLRSHGAGSLTTAEAEDELQHWPGGGRRPVRFSPTSSVSSTASSFVPSRVDPIENCWCHQIDGRRIFCPRVGEVSLE